MENGISLGPFKSNQCGECRSRMISWCINCKNNNWVHGQKLDDCTTWCASTYYTGWTTDDDCTVSDAKKFCKSLGVE
jgi:hypothetical protein